MLRIRVLSRFLVGSPPILQCSLQPVGHLRNIRLPSSAFAPLITLVFWIQIAANEACDALPGFRSERTRTPEFDQTFLHARNGEQQPDRRVAPKRTGFRST